MTLDVSCFAHLLPLRPAPSNPAVPKPLRILGKVLKKLLIFVVSAVLLVVLGELVTRAMEPGPFALLDSNPYETVQGLRIHKKDFAGRWDGTWYTTNSLGLRGPEVEKEKGPDEYRVVCVGDSCTFGKAVLETECYPRQLETMLADEVADDRSAVVVNCGVNGSSGKTYIQMMKKVGVRLEPDLFVIGMNLNDFPNVLRKLDNKQKQATVRQTVSKVVGGNKNLNRLNESALFRFSRAFYYNARRTKAWEDAERFASESGKEIANAAKKANKEGIEDALEKQISDMKAIADNAGAEIAFFLFPYESQVYLEEYDRTPIERLRETCISLEVPFVDLAEEFRKVAYETDPPREMYLFGDRYHPRAIGYEIVAKKVVEVIRQRGWLTRD